MVSRDPCPCFPFELRPVALEVALVGGEVGVGEFPLVFFWNFLLGDDVNEAINDVCCPWFNGEGVNFLQDTEMSEAGETDLEEQNIKCTIQDRLYSFTKLENAAKRPPLSPTVHHNDRALLDI